MRELPPASWLDLIAKSLNRSKTKLLWSLEGSERDSRVKVSAVGMEEEGAGAGDDDEAVANDDAEEVSGGDVGERGDLIPFPFSALVVFCDVGTMASCRKATQTETSIARFSRFPKTVSFCDAMMSDSLDRILTDGVLAEGFALGSLRITRTALELSSSDESTSESL